MRRIVLFDRIWEDIVMVINKILCYNFFLKKLNVMREKFELFIFELFLWCLE